MKMETYVFFGFTKNGANVYSTAIRLKIMEAIMSNYSRAFVFQKETDLMPYFERNIAHRIGFDSKLPSHQKTMERYVTKRNVQLVALFRWERERCYCKIKCPINPLPIKGEFEAVGGAYAVTQLLRNLGWTLEREHNLTLFK